jgi:hypothetical protein
LYSFPLVSIIIIIVFLVCAQIAYIPSLEKWRLLYIPILREAKEKAKRQAYTPRRRMVPSLLSRFRRSEIRVDTSLLPDLGHGCLGVPKQREPKDAGQFIEALATALNINENAPAMMALPTPLPSSA